MFPTILSLFIKYCFILGLCNSTLDRVMPTNLKFGNQKVVPKSSRKVTEFYFWTLLFPKQSVYPKTEDDICISIVKVTRNLNSLLWRAIRGPGIVLNSDQKLVPNSSRKVTEFFFFWLFCSLGGFVNSKAKGNIFSIDLVSHGTSTYVWVKL